jgi:hypothetical protein
VQMIAVDSFNIRIAFPCVTRSVTLLPAWMLP